MSKELILSPRLKKIAKEVPEGARLADIGTDHALLPAYLCRTGKIVAAIASDVREGPLRHAKKTIKQYQLEDYIETRLSNGFSAFQAGEFDCAVIAGMGGELIASLISDVPLSFFEDKTLILQPMSMEHRLRKMLWDESFTIARECYAKEDGRIYAIFICHPTKQITTYDDADLYIGKGSDSLAFPEFIVRQMKKIKTMRDGIASSSQPDKNQVTYYDALSEKLLARWRETI